MTTRERHSKRKMPGRQTWHGQATIRAKQRGMSVTMKEKVTMIVEDTNVTPHMLPGSTQNMALAKAKGVDIFQR